MDGTCSFLNKFDQRFILEGWEFKLAIVKKKMNLSRAIGQGY